jgi:hypothetical protein
MVHVKKEAVASLDKPSCQGEGILMVTTGWIAILQSSKTNVVGAVIAQVASVLMRARRADVIVGTATE